MSARREKRIRKLERRVEALERIASPMYFGTVAAPGALDAYWSRKPYSADGDFVPPLTGHPKMGPFKRLGKVVDRVLRVLFSPSMFK
jgi:hypothetical protein